MAAKFTTARSGIATSGITSRVIWLLLLALAPSGAQANPMFAPAMSPDLAARWLDFEISRGVPPTSDQVWIQLHRQWSADQVTAWKVAGAQLRPSVSIGGKPTWLAQAPVELIAEWAHRDDVAVIEAAWPRLRLPGWSAALAAAVPAQLERPAVWQRRDDQGRRIRGAEQVFVDFDGGLDVYHPLFFRADAGAYDWIDVDEDGVLTVGVDFVDLDGDAAAGFGERVEAFGGGLSSLYGDFEAANAGELGVVWLYADQNDNGARDWGGGAGFDEDTPAWGEPLFVPDDVNANGALDVGEKLFRLGTSKIRGFMDAATGAKYERGVNLHWVPRPGEKGLHGTGVGGILVGGQPGRSQVAGMAPDAELLFVDLTYMASDAPWLPTDAWHPTGVEVGTWAIEHGATHFVHEYGSQDGHFADGSSLWEQQLSSWATQGTPQLTATHNYAGLQGKVILPLSASPPAAPVTRTFTIAPTAPAAQYVAGTLRWQGGVAQDLQLTLTLPTGGSVSIGAPGQQSVDDSAVVTWRGTSNRGTHLVRFTVWRPAQGGTLPVAKGTYSLDIAASVGVELHANLSDSSGYAYSVHWDGDTTDAATVAFPATADDVIRVGACSGNFADPGTSVGALRAFSGRGPRIDGLRGVDVVAPDDPLTALARMPLHGDGHYLVFGGTSGALPVVAAAHALWSQATGGDAASWWAQLAAVAQSDSLTGELPNPEWGFGRANLSRIVTGADPAANSPPALDPNDVAGRPGEQTMFDAGMGLDAEQADNELTVRWDFDYDGLWDVEGAGWTAPTHVYAEVGQYWAKVEVEDEHGATAAHLIGVSISNEPPVAEPAPDVEIADSRGGDTGADGSESDVGELDGGGSDVGELDGSESDGSESDSQGKPGADAADSGAPSDAADVVTAEEAANGDGGGDGGCHTQSPRTPLGWTGLGLLALLHARRRWMSASSQAPH